MTEVANRRQGIGNRRLATLGIRCSVLVPLLILAVPVHCDSEVKTELSARAIYTASSDVSLLAFSPFGNSLAGGLKNGSLQVWSGSSPSPATVHPGGMKAIRFSADGMLLAAACTDGTIRLWHMPGLAPDATLDGDKSGALAVDLSADGRMVAVGFGNGQAAVWTLTDGKKLWSFDAAKKAVKAVAFSRDGGLLVTLGEDGTVGRFDLSTGEAEPPANVAAVSVKGQKPMHSELRGTAFAGYGQLIAVGFRDEFIRGFGAFADSEYREWVALIDTGTLRKKREPLGVNRTDISRRLALSEDGTLLLTMGEDPHTVRLWDVRRGEDYPLPDFPGKSVDALAFGRGASGLKIAVAAGREITVYPITLKSDALATDALAVTVFPSDPTDTALGYSVADAIQEAVLSSGQYVLITRSNVDESLSQTEYHLSRTDLVDKEGRLKMGRIINAKFFLTGKLTRQGTGGYHLSEELFSTETSQVKSSKEGDAASPEEARTLARSLAVQTLRAAGG